MFRVHHSMKGTVLSTTVYFHHAQRFRVHQLDGSGTVVVIIEDGQADSIQIIFPEGREGIAACQAMLDLLQATLNNLIGDAGVAAIERQLAADNAAVWIELQHSRLKDPPEPS
jgi:hypothetical protein